MHPIFRRLLAPALTLLIIVGLAAPAYAEETGTISGQVVDSKGEPAWHTTVDVFFTSGMYFDSAFVEHDGAYTVGDLRPGDYKLKFRSSTGSQYAHQKATFAEAQTFTVTAGQTTTVDETLLPGGVLELTVTDSATGRPVDNVCAKLSGTIDEKCGATNGVLRLTDVPNGKHTVILRAPDGLHRGQRLSDVEIKLAETTKVAVKLEPSAAITTLVRDAKTKQPAVFACVYPLTLNFGQQGYGENCRYKTGHDGKVVIGELPADTFTLLVVPFGGGHGIQWVGYRGGTGDQYQARRIYTTIGRSSEVPPVEMDQAGSLTGTLTEAATGKPIESGLACASVLPEVADFSRPAGARCAGDGGRYEVDGLGPYEWPVQFTAAYGRFAWHWSGNVPDRTRASKVKITAGQTATADTKFNAPTKVTGRLLNQDGTAANDADIYAFNARTGDLAGPVARYWYSPYELEGLTTEQIKIYYQTRGRPDGWYENKRDFRTATPVAVREGETRTIDLVVPAS